MAPPPFKFLAAPLPSNEPGIFQSLGNINFVFSTKRQSQKEGHGSMPSLPFKYAPTRKFVLLVPLEKGTQQDFPS